MFHERGADLDGEDDVRDAYEERRGPYCGVEMAEQPALRSVIIPAILSNCRSSLNHRHEGREAAENSLNFQI